MDLTVDVEIAYKSVAGHDRDTARYKRNYGYGDGRTALLEEEGKMHEAAAETNDR